MSSTYESEISSSTSSNFQPSNFARVLNDNKSERRNPANGSTRRRFFALLCRSARRVPGGVSGRTDDRSNSTECKAERLKTVPEGRGTVRNKMKIENKIGRYENCIATRYANIVVYLTRRRLMTGRWHEAPELFTANPPSI